MGLSRSEGTVPGGGRSQLLPQPEPVPGIPSWSHMHAPQNHSWGILPCTEPKVHQGEWKISHGTEGARPPVGAWEALGLETGDAARGTSIVPALLPAGAVTVTAGPFGQQENFGRHQHQILRDSSSC